MLPSMAFGVGYVCGAVIACAAFAIAFRRVFWPKGGGHEDASHR
jgi:hypothetical protein